MIELEITINKVSTDSVVVPMKDADGILQIRRDGIYFNGDFYMWEVVDNVVINVLKT